MTNEMQVFENREFGQVRIIEKDGDVWFVAKDVCDCLGISNNRDALTRLDDDEKNTVVLTDGTPGNPEKSIINEFGLYTLVLSSRKPEAKQFKRWVTHEVIPSIRKNGGYIANQESLTPEQIIANALVVANNIIADMNKQIEGQKPKVDYYDKVLDSSACYTTTQLAQGFEMTARQLNIILQQAGIQYKQSGQWILKGKYRSMGLARTRTHTFTRSDGSIDTSHSTVWTEKGRYFIADLLEDL